MGQLKLSTLAVILGTVVTAVNLIGVFKPEQARQWARRFPRYTPIGWVLMLVATAWFLYYVSQEAVSDFASFKPVLFIVFAAVGVGTCLFVQDFLPVRGAAVLMLLLAKLIVDTARWEDTPWRLVMVVWAYLMVLAGMWLTISPWRLRDMIDWATRDVQRVRTLSAVRAAFGVLLIVLGLTVYCPSEPREHSGRAPVPRLVVQSVWTAHDDRVEPRAGRFIVRGEPFAWVGANT